MLLLAVVGGYYLTRETPVAKQVPLQSETETPEMRVQNVHLVEQAETGEGWELLARDAEFYAAKQRVMVRQVRAQLLSKAVQPLHVVANHGQIDSATGNITVQGQVQIQYMEGYIIETEVLHWDATRRILQTDAAVKIDGVFVQIAGMGLHGNIDQQRFVLQDDVHAVFQMR